MERSEIATASDEELASALNNKDNGMLYYAVAGEIARRKAVAQASQSDLSILNPRSGTGPTFPFDPKTDISADARYLWKRIFIWFWIAPLGATLIYFLATLK